MCVFPNSSNLPRIRYVPAMESIMPCDCNAEEEGYIFEKKTRLMIIPYPVITSTGFLPSDNHRSYRSSWGLWRAMCSKEQSKSTRMSAYVMVDFGFYFIPQKYQIVLFKLYKDMVFNQSINLTDLQLYSDEGLLQELIESTYPTRLEPLKRTLLQWVGRDIATIISSYVTPAIWEDFCRLQLRVRTL